MKMKKLTQIVSLLTAAALCVLLPDANVLTTHADTAVTYYVRHVGGNEGWRFQTGSWNDETPDRDLYYMFDEIKDGDIVVVDSNGSDEFISLDYSKRLSNLTIVKGAHAIVSAPGIDEFYALAGSTSAVTGDVKNAHTYDDAGVTFHSNVNNLEMIDTQAMATGTVTVAGTTGHAVRRTESGYVYFDLYNVAKGKLHVDNGSLETDASYYSTSPASGQVAATTAAPAGSASASASQQTPAASGEYDEVPKTGDSPLIFWLFGISILCLTGRHMIRKSKRL